MDLIDIFRTPHPNSEYTFFSSAHGTFSKINYILCHKSNLSKFKKIDIISSIFSDHNAMRLDINYKKITVRNTNTWRLNNMFLNKQQVTGISLVAQTIKHLPTMWETQVQSLGWEDLWRRKWQPTPVLLPGKFHGWRSVVGYSPWGHKESDMTSLSLS